MSKRKDRRAAVNSFKVVDVSLPPLTSFVPVDPVRRAKQWDWMYFTHGVVLPDYEVYKRRNLEYVDLIVFERDWWIIYEYNYKRYKVTVKPGAVIDSASVPTVFVRRNLTKRGQHIQEAAALHDSLFALKPFGYSFDDANNLFEAMIRYTGISTDIARKFYMLGVRSPVGWKIYDEANPDKHWLKNFVEFEELS